MKNLLATTILALVCMYATAQSRAALEGNHNLPDRYKLMKDKAETFNEYEVIKQDILDGVWRIAMDTLKKERASLAEANATIVRLRGEIAGAEAKVKQADEAMSRSEYERTHLSVFGIPVAKPLFVTVMFVLVAGLLAGLVTIMATVKVLRKSSKEKDLTIYGVTTEFEEFRKKALEKEVKISRELQNERNKLAAMRSN